MTSAHRTILILLASLTPVLALTTAELESLVTSLKGDENRLFRWNASPTTAERQETDCSKLTEAAKLLFDSDVSVEDKAHVAEYATFCITDNPKNRATFGDVEGVHKVVIDLVANEDVKLSYLACHLIYIATYANEKNHQAFIKDGAVEALGKVILDDDAIPVQHMWAASALQNLAASYCETEDGTCYWEWTSKDEHIQLDPSSPLTSDGTAARKAMLQMEDLVDLLIALACEGPLDEEEEDVAMPGEFAVAGVHDYNAEIITWAAMASLKNLALEPSSKESLEHVIPCACFVKESADWLEESKSIGFIYHMRRHEDPCWMRDDEAALCIDSNFLDEGLHTCEDYEDTDEEECAASKDAFSGVAASEACCECGGGFVIQIEDEEHDEL